MGAARVALLVLVLTVALAAVGAASSAIRPPLYKNCTAFNARYPHGVGRANAHDRSPSPVTTFVRNTRLFNLAVKWNARLDGDKDGVACEKR